MDSIVRGLNVHYEEVGAGRPVVFLHGWPGNGLTTMPDFEPFFASRTGWRRIYPDALGIVKSPAPDWLQGPDDLLDVLADFMDAVSPAEPVVVAGVSWGAYYALGLVHHRPDRVAGVLLSIGDLEPLASNPNRQMPEQQVLHYDPDMVATLEPGEEWLRDWLVVQSLPALQRVRQWIWPPRLDEANDELLYGKAFSFDPAALSRPCLAPALVLMGHQDHAAGWHKGWSMIDQFPRGTFVVLDAAGHLLDVEQPALREALISEWLDRVEADSLPQPNR